MDPVRGERIVRYDGRSPRRRRTRGPRDGRRAARDPRRRANPGRDDAHSRTRLRSRGGLASRRGHRPPAGGDRAARALPRGPLTRRRRQRRHRPRHRARRRHARSGAPAPADELLVRALRQGIDRVASAETSRPWPPTRGSRRTSSRRCPTGCGGPRHRSRRPAAFTAAGIFTLDGDAARLARGRRAAQRRGQGDRRTSSGKAACRCPRRSCWFRDGRPSKSSRRPWPRASRSSRPSRRPPRSRSISPASRASRSWASCATADSTSIRAAERLSPPAPAR